MVTLCHPSGSISGSKGASSIIYSPTKSNAVVGSGSDSAASPAAAGRGSTPQITNDNDAKPPADVMGVGASDATTAIAVVSGDSPQKSDDAKPPHFAPELSKTADSATVARGISSRTRTRNSASKPNIDKDEVVSKKPPSTALDCKNTKPKAAITNLKSPPAVCDAKADDNDEVEERAWKCHRCSRHNHLHVLKCPTCFAWKGVKGPKKGSNTAKYRASTEGCEIVCGVERHGDDCFVCGGRGELICCDKCDKVYHGSCLKVDDVNTLPDPWHCPACAPGSDENNKVAAVKTEEEEEPMAMAVKSEEQDDGEGHNDENEVLGVLGTRKKRKTGCNDDQCYICENGGILVCCDYCDKSFHMHCHVPPLHSIPKGEKWKCCECAASSFTRRFKCGQCEACLREDCGKCPHCLDKTKFGGMCVIKQVCIHKKCPFKRYALPATVSPELKQKMVQAKKEEIDSDEEPVALFASADQAPGKPNNIETERQSTREEGSNMNQSASTNARQSKRARKPSQKAKEVANGNIATSPVAAGKRKIRNVTEQGNAAESRARDNKPGGSTEVPSAEGRQTIVHENNSNAKNDTACTKPAASVEVPVRHDMDNFSQATLPFLPGDINNSSSDDDETEVGGNVPSDLLVCQMELMRARAEITRLDNENKRLKSAVKALSASLTG